MKDRERAGPQFGKSPEGPTSDCQAVRIYFIVFSLYVVPESSEKENLTL